MKINRQQLLAELESVAPGLSPKETVQQSNCFAFKDGKVMTFNEEVACRRPTSLRIEGAVAASPLLHLLDKFTDENVEISTSDGQLMVSVKNRHSGIRMDKDIDLPINEVPLPEKWSPIPADLINAIDVVNGCAYPNESHGHHISCVHFSPTFIEACDNQQIARYKVATGVSESTLVKAVAIRSIVPIGATRWALSNSWMHFKVESGLVISCRLYLEEYPNLKSFLSIDNPKPMKFPWKITDAVETAEEFLDDTMFDGSLKVILSSGRIQIESYGMNGWYKQVSKANYKGDRLEFLIAPKILKEVVHKYKKVLVGERRLKVDGGNLQFATALGVPKKKKSKEKSNGQAESEE